MPLKRLWASGTFENRFAILHPNRVIAVSAGAVNGIVTLRRAEMETDRDPEFARGLSLEFPVGVADVDRYTGATFDIQAFQGVRQFIYMGGQDDKETLRWPEVWTETDLRASAILICGPAIHADRSPFCASVYEESEVPSVFRTYPETDHAPTPVMDDIVRFHAGAIAGSDFSDTPPTSVVRQSCKALTTSTQC